jgi:signal transduction histidine kinase
MAAVPQTRYTTVLRSAVEGLGAAIYAVGVSFAARARIHDPSWRLAPSRADVLITAAVLIAEVTFTTLAAQNQTDRAAMDAGAYALLVVGAASLIARRSQPIATLAIAFGSTLAYWLLDYPRGPIFIAVIVAFGTVAVEGRRAIAWATLGLGYVAFLGLGELTGTVQVNLGKALAVAAWLLVIGAGAELLRTRLERIGEARRVREQESLRRVGEERLRIARELHDVLAHNVSLINVQAGVALHLLDQHPEQAEPALTAIKQASAETLREMRSVLGMLRQADEQAPRSPTPSISRLDRLIARMGAAGLDVGVAVEGDERQLPPAVDLAAYRVAQEALTNVARHSGEAAARVRIRYGDRDLLVEVSNQGQHRGAPAIVEGNGIVGMRERALALGGEFSAGPTPGGGFTVRTLLPLEAER